MNNPAACAVELAVSVCDDGVKVSCGSADVVATAAAPLAAPVAGELWVCGACCVDGWLSEAAFKLATLVFVTDMIHLTVAAMPERSGCRCATRKLQREW